MQPGRITALVFATVFAVTSNATAQCTAGDPTTVGSATVLGSGFPGPMNIPDTTVTVLSVDCDGLSVMGCSLQISEPNPNVPFRGTILFSSGAQGFAYYSGEALGLPLVLRLQGEGWRCVDRAWAPGWFTTGGSTKKNSCRYATVLQWVHDNLHTTGAFAAIGSSAGGAELGYSLTTWGCDQYLDAALFTGAPPFARFDKQCPRPASPQWLAECNALPPANVLNCAPIECVGQGGFGRCTSCSPTATLAELRDDSILHTNAQLDFQTRIHLLHGGDDCGPTVAQTMFFFNAVTSEKVLEFVPDSPHFVVQTPQGQEAMVQALYTGTSCNHPATMAWQEWPQIGGDLNIDFHGPDNGNYICLLGTGILTFPLGSLGWLCVGPPIFLLGTGGLDAGGRGTLSLPIPANPAFTNQQIVMQGITQGPLGDCLTNRIQFEFLP